MPEARLADSRSEAESLGRWSDGVMEALAGGREPGAGRGGGGSSWFFVLGVVGRGVMDGWKMPEARLADSRPETS